MEINKIYNGDCLQLMKNIKECSIDLICCDPPFGTTQNNWDKIINMIG
jgi:site-specific DNA-methyltransferase (adenine-specific)